MKNLNKKIGAIALAAMVVSGGFVASGAQSFAFEARERMGKIDDIIKKYGYEVYDFYGSRDDVNKSSKNLFSKYYGYRRVFQLSRGENYLNRLVKSGIYDVFILRQNDSQFYIVKKHSVEVPKIEEE